jgi:penicillin-binding protein 1C
MAVNAKTGKYIITVTDEAGNEIKRKIEIIAP